MSTSAKITNLLNREMLTVNELAVALSISRNSAHVQVNKLEAAGTILKCEKRMPGSAGKPAYQYRTVAGQEDTHSTAYKPLLHVLMQTISADLSLKSRSKLLENTGRSLARATGLRPTKDSGTDIRKSVDAVNALGALAEVTQRGEKSFITCHSCPVATLVHCEPMTCQMIAAFFSEACGKKVSVECRKNETVVCGFAIG